MLVDSCVWIDHFKGTESPYVAALRHELLVRTDRVLLADIVRLEVLRGYAPGQKADEVRGFFDRLSSVGVLDRDRIEPALRVERALQRIGRRMGTVDLLIGTWCISEQVPLLTRDKAFDWLADLTGLHLVVSPH